MEPIITNSNLLPISFRPDIYGTYDIWNYVPDYDDHCQYEQKNWVMAISKKILQYIIDERSDELFEAWIVFINDVLWVDSPREYNFGTDSFDFSINVDMDKMYRYIDSSWTLEMNKIDKDEYDNFLRETYTSYDWKISLMPNTYASWLLEEDEEIKVMCVVAYILRDVKDPQTELELSEDAYNCIY